MNANQEALAAFIKWLLMVYVGPVVGLAIAAVALLVWFVRRRRKRKRS